MPTRLVAHFVQLLAEAHPVIGEYGIEETAHVLQHDSLRTALIHQTQCLRKKISLVFRTQLLSCL